MGNDRIDRAPLVSMTRQVAKPARSLARLAPSATQEIPSFATRSTNDADGNWWMITLSDLTLLLFGFLVFWHMSSKLRMAVRLESSQPAVESATPSLVKSLPDTRIAPEVWHALQADLTQFIGAAGLRDDVVVEATAGEILLSLRDRVPFASGKADLRAQALPMLNKVAATILAQADLFVAINGHTDSLRIATARFPSNWELSTARASAVARYLIEKGIHPKRISVQGFADHRPRETNATPTQRRTNRRVEIKLFQENSAAIGASGGK